MKPRSSPREARETRPQGSNVESKPMINSDQSIPAGQRKTDAESEIGFNGIGSASQHGSGNARPDRILRNNRRRTLAYRVMPT